MSVLALITLTGCDLFNERYVYQCQVSDLEELGDGEIAPLQRSIFDQGVSLNSDIQIKGVGFNEALAITDADDQAIDFFEQNLYLINPRDLILVRGKSFNYTLFRFDGPNNNRPVVIATQRITKK